MENSSITYPVSIENELGTTVIESEPNALAVFDAGMIDILDTLGFGDKVVAVTHEQAFPDYLAQYDSDMYVNLGGFKDWDEEALIDANPDLIFAGFRQNRSIESVQAIMSLDDFLNTLICGACSRKCPLLAPRCRRGMSKAGTQSAYYSGAVALLESSSIIMEEIQLELEL